MLNFAEVYGRVSQMKTFNIFFLFFIMDDMECWSRCAAISSTVTRRFSFTMASTAAMVSVSLLGVSNQVEESLLQN